LTPSFLSPPKAETSIRLILGSIARAMRLEGWGGFETALRASSA
jgi:hypothetical protein